MKTVFLIARYLLGLIFLIFGLNGFIHFIPMQAMPGPAGQFLGAIGTTGYMTVIFALQLIGAILLLSGQYVPLGLVVLGPVVMNILLFHLFLAPAGLPIALLVAILWCLTALGYRWAFEPLLSNRRHAV